MKHLIEQIKDPDKAAEVIKNRLGKEKASREFVLAVAAILKERDKYKKALEVYANTDNWQRTGCDCENESWQSSEYSEFIHGGNGFALASAALARGGEGKND